MRALIQRVSQADVRVQSRLTGEIGPGILVLLGVTDSDTEAQSHFLAQKTAKLRIFNDEQGKMNLSLLDTGGSALVVSQFTLYADARKGNRPSYLAAAQPQHADALYQHYMQQLQLQGVSVAAGEFGAMMRVSLVNDGPVTIWLDSGELMGS